MAKEPTSIWTHKIAHKMDSEVLFFLGKNGGSEVLFWLMDSCDLVMLFQKGFLGSSAYYDYSFLVLPAFKALEKWLLIIAPHLGVPEKMIQEANAKGPGVFLRNNQIEKFFDEVLEKLKTEADTRNRLRSAVSSLNAILGNFRNDPAHCNYVIENPEQADTMVQQIIGNIDDITARFLQDKIIK